MHNILDSAISFGFTGYIQWAPRPLFAIIRLVKDVTDSLK